jgi:flagellar protein FlbD
MIELTQLSDKAFWVNPHQIEYIEKTPDTMLAMLSGKRIIVKESVDEVIDRIVEYRRRIGAFKNEE